jgi:hypothetical protein
MNGEEYVQLFKSKDQIQIMAIKDALISKNINCIVRAGLENLDRCISGGTALQ